MNIISFSPWTLNFNPLSSKDYSCWSKYINVSGHTWGFQYHKLFIEKFLTDKIKFLSKLEQIFEMNSSVSRFRRQNMLTQKGSSIPHDERAIGRITQLSSLSPNAKCPTVDFGLGIKVLVLNLNPKKSQMLDSIIPYP